MKQDRDPRAAKRSGKRTKRCASVRLDEIDSPDMARHPKPAKARRTPKLGRHSSGQARITINGKTHYCGRWGSAEAYARYAELLREWQGNDGKVVTPVPHAGQVLLKVRDLFRQFLDYVDSSGRYRKNGKPTQQRSMFALIGRELGEFAGHLPVTKVTEATLVQSGQPVARSPSSAGKRVTATCTETRRANPTPDHSAYKDTPTIGCQNSSRPTGSGDSRPFVLALSQPRPAPRSWSTVYWRRCRRPRDLADARLHERTPAPHHGLGLRR